MIDFIHYEVKFGDTILEIAKKHDMDVNLILYYNHYNSFYPGIILRIPRKITITTKNKDLSRDVEFYLKRHTNKKHLYNFYRYKRLN